MRIKAVKMPSDSEIGALKTAILEAVDGKSKGLVMTVISAILVRAAVESCGEDVEHARRFILNGMNASFDIYKEIQAQQKKEPMNGTRRRPE